MKPFKLALSIAVLCAALLVGWIYAEHKNEIAFSPSIFFTEFWRFLALTVCWTVILEFYRRADNQKKNKTVIEFLITANINSLLSKLQGSGLRKEELTEEIKQILSNVSDAKNNLNLTSASLKALVGLETELKKTEFTKAVQYIELQIRDGNSYAGEDPHNLIIQTLNNCNHVS